jgi:hypothetical protein
MPMIDGLTGAVTCLHHQPEVIGEESAADSFGTKPSGRA